MGLDYSIDLYFRIEDIEKVLALTSATAEISDDANTLVTLPNGKSVTVPFTSHFRKADTVQLTINENISLDTVLWFEEDDCILEYFEGENPHKMHKDGMNYYRIGYIYLYITCDKQYARFAFTAATSSMSRLFEKSLSIQKHFLEILTVAEGVIGVIDIESWEYLTLENSSLRIANDRDFANNKYSGIDDFVAHMLEVKAYEQSRWQKLNDPVAFYAKWVTCFNRYLSPWQFIDELRAEEQQELSALFASRMTETTDEIVAFLLSERNWLPRCVGSCLIAFSKRQNFEDVIGNLLLQYPHNAQALCLSLLRLNNEKSGEYLGKYLDKYLPLENTNRNERENIIVDWVLAALKLLDVRNGTTNASKYLFPNGLWIKFVEQGFEELISGEERPNWQYEYLKDWLVRWDIDKATHQLQSVLAFVEQYFDKNPSPVF